MIPSPRGGLAMKKEKKMFTAKVRDEQGNENVFEARRVEWVEETIKTPSGNNDVLPGLLIHYEDGGCTHYARHDANRGMKVWVMNRYGATIATYDF